MLLSAVVLWEVAIKGALGKLAVDDGFYARVHTFDFTPLAVTGVHAWAVRDLPLHHHDPFDRVLVAQARVEGAAIVSADARLPAYGAPVLWG